MHVKHIILNKEHIPQTMLENNIKKYESKQKRFIWKEIPYSKSGGNRNADIVKVKKKKTNSGRHSKAHCAIVAVRQLGLSLHPMAL